MDLAGCPVKWEEAQERTRSDDMLVVCQTWRMAPHGALHRYDDQKPDPTDLLLIEGIFFP